MGRISVTFLVLATFSASRRADAASAFLRPSFPSIAQQQPLLLYESSLPEPSDSNFGRREYWNDIYSNSQQDTFSWYTGWEELEPFVRELIPLQKAHILVPGIGNDGAIVDMYDAGYHSLTAFDYADAGVDCARVLMGNERIRGGGGLDSPGVTLLVADARDLPFQDAIFDAVLDKGTLDAIYLSGGRDKERASKHLQMGVDELARVVRVDGVVVSISAACVDAVQQAFDSSIGHWEQIRDGSPYMTEDGFASNNVDGTLLAWKRLHVD